MTAAPPLLALEIVELARLLRLRPLREAKDAAGHEHAGKGEGGGQFVKGSGGGEEAKETSAVIGKGNTGEVRREGDTIVKSATRHGVATNEAKAYKKLEGVEGVAAGKEDGDKIRVPFFKNIISVDVIPEKQRASIAPLIARNEARINETVSAMSAAGVSYNDPLQMGLDKDKKTQLFDFSNAAFESPDAALESNIEHLAIFYEQFGLPKAAKAVMQSFEFLRAAKDEDYAAFWDDDEKAALDKVKSGLGGKQPVAAYYATNARHVGIPGVGQSEPLQGRKIILSPRALTAAEMKQWEITPVIHSAHKAVLESRELREAFDESKVKRDHGQFAEKEGTDDGEERGKEEGKSSPSPPSPHFTGFDKSGQKWINGKAVARGAKPPEATTEKPATPAEKHQKSHAEWLKRGEVRAEQEKHLKTVDHIIKGDPLGRLAHEHPTVQAERHAEKAIDDSLGHIEEGEPAALLAATENWYKARQNQHQFLRDSLAAAGASPADLKVLDRAIERGRAKIEKIVGKYVEVAKEIDALTEAVGKIEEEEPDVDEEVPEDRKPVEPDEWEDEEEPEEPESPNEPGDEPERDDFPNDEAYKVSHDEWENEAEEYTQAKEVYPAERAEWEKEAAETEAINKQGQKDYKEALQAYETATELAEKEWTTELKAKHKEWEKRQDKAERLLDKARDKVTSGDFEEAVDDADGATQEKVQELRDKLQDQIEDESTDDPEPEEPSEEDYPDEPDPGDWEEEEDDDEEDDE